MASLSFIAFMVALAQFVDPVLKAYYWIVGGTTVLIASILIVRCAWRAEALFRRFVEHVEKSAG